MLKLQYFGHLMRTADSLENTLMLGKTEGRRRGQQRMRWLDGTTNSTDTSLSKLQEMLKVSKARCAAVHRVTKSRTQLSDRTTAMEQNSDDIVHKDLGKNEKCVLLGWPESSFRLFHKILTEKSKPTF